MTRPRWQRSQNEKEVEAEPKSDSVFQMGCPSHLYVQGFRVRSRENGFAQLEEVTQGEKFVPGPLSHAVLGVLTLNLEPSCVPLTVTSHFCTLS